MTRVIRALLFILSIFALGIVSADECLAAKRILWKGPVWRTQCRHECNTCWVTIQLPLCPKLAELSYGSHSEGKGKIIGKFLAEEAKRRGITISPLSQVVAEFSGPAAQITWLRNNYPTLLCAFNTSLAPVPEDLYKSSMHHAKEWIQLVENGHLEQLMDTQHVFCANCCLSFQPMSAN